MASTLDNLSGLATIAIVGLLAIKFKDQLGAVFNWLTDKGDGNIDPTAGGTRTDSGQNTTVTDEDGNPVDMTDYDNLTEGKAWEKPPEGCRQIGTTSPCANLSGLPKAACELGRFLTGGGEVPVYDCTPQVNPTAPTASEPTPAPTPVQPIGLPIPSDLSQVIPGQQYAGTIDAAAMRAAMYPNLDLKAVPIYERPFGVCVNGRRRVTQEEAYTTVVNKFGERLYTQRFGCGFTGDGLEEHTVFYCDC